MIAVDGRTEDDVNGKVLGQEIVDMISTGDALFHAVNESDELQEAGPHALADFVEDVLAPLRSHLWEIIETTRPSFDPDNR